MNFIIRSASLAALCLALTSCQDTVNTVENADKNATPNVVRDSRFVTDAWLRDRLVLSSVKTAITPSGHMAAEVTATNVRTGAFAQAWSGLTGEVPYEVDYKFVWQDENGMAVDSSLSIWQSRQIKPGETVYFKSVAPTKKCRDFVLNLKEHK